MTTAPHVTAGPAPQAPKATAKQQRFLRELALRTGQSFELPRSRAHASAQIEAMLASERATAPGLQRDDARRDRRAVSRRLAERPADATRVREHEVSGHGSSARWS